MNTVKFHQCTCWTDILWLHCSNFVLKKNKTTHHYHHNHLYHPCYLVISLPVNRLQITGCQFRVKNRTSPKTITQPGGKFVIFLTIQWVLGGFYDLLNQQRSMLSFNLSGKYKNDRRQSPGSGIKRGTSFTQCSRWTQWTLVQYGVIQYPNTTCWFSSLVLIEVLVCSGI